MTDASAPITQSDKLAKIYQPLDYSFYDIKEVADIHNNEPRFLPGLKLNCPKSSSGKWLTKTLKLNNNLLEGLQDVPTIVTELFGCPEWITWLDVSCNKIHAISPAIKQLCSLKILYLHGNQIKAMQEVQRLTNLPDLVKLTLHGNPVEREKRMDLNVCFKRRDRMAHTVSERIFWEEGLFPSGPWDSPKFAVTRFYGGLSSRPPNSGRIQASEKSPKENERLTTLKNCGMKRHNAD